MKDIFKLVGAGFLLLFVVISTLAAVGLPVALIYYLVTH